MAKTTLSTEEAAAVKSKIAAAEQFQKNVWTPPDNTHTTLHEQLQDVPAINLAVVRGRYWSYLRENDPEVVAPRRASNQVTPKLLAKQAIITAGEGNFFCEARDNRFTDQAMDAQALLNDHWDAFYWDIPVERARWDSDVYGYGVVQVGWLWEREDAEGNRESLEGERGEPLVPQGAMPTLLPNEAAGIPRGVFMPPPADVQEYENAAAAEEALREQVAAEDRAVWGEPRKDDPFMERFSPRYLLIDPAATSWDLSDARYVFRKKSVITRKLKAVPGLTNTDKLTGSPYVRRDMPEGLQLADNEPISTIYDGYVWMEGEGGKETLMHLVMAEEIQEPLFVGESRYTEDGASIFPGENPFPFRVIPGQVLDNDCPLPEAAVSQAVDLQLSYDEAWDTIINCLRTSPRMWKALPKLLDQTAKSALAAGEDGTVVEIADLNGLEPLEVPQVNPEAYQVIAGVPQEIGRQLGIDEFTEGVTPQKDVLAAEVKAIQQTGGARTSSGLKNFRRFKEDLGGCVLALIMCFGDQDRGFRINRDDGGTDFGSTNGMDLRGIKPGSATPENPNGDMERIGVQFRVKINADTEGPRTIADKRQEDLGFLEICMKLAGQPDPWRPGMTAVNWRPIFIKLAKDFGYRDTETLCPGEPSEQDKVAMLLQQLQQAQQENQQLQQMVEELAPLAQKGMQPASPRGGTAR